MRNKILFTLVFVGIAAATVAVSPKPVKAQDYSTCKCNGGCDNDPYYNYCGNGMCSLFCTGNQT